MVTAINSMVLKPTSFTYEIMKMDKMLSVRMLNSDAALGNSRHIHAAFQAFTDSCRSPGQMSLAVRTIYEIRCDNGHI
jgi:hypothetical protein